MRVLDVGRRVVTGRGARAAAAVLAVLLLAAVPALGVTRLGGLLSASWGARPAAARASDALAFDVPASTLTEREAVERAKPDGEPVVELRDWTFTDDRSDLL